MKRFISFIFLILLCFIFLGFGVSFAAIEFGIGQKIETECLQVAASPSLTDNAIVYNPSAAKLSVVDFDCLVLRQPSEMFDRQTIIKNIKMKHPAIKADGTIAAEIGTVLKCPIYRHL